MWFCRRAVQCGSAHSEAAFSPRGLQVGFRRKDRGWVAFFGSLETHQILTGTSFPILVLPDFYITLLTTAILMFLEQFQLIVNSILCRMKSKLLIFS